MKRILVFLISLILILQFTGCGFVGVMVSDSNTELVQSITKAFDEKDKESLKNLFAQKITKTVDIDKQIDKAFKLYNTKSNKIKYENCPTEEKSVTNGSVKKYISDEFIVKTDNGNFCFYFDTFYNESNDSENGLTVLCVQSDYNEKQLKYDKEVVIGINEVNWMKE